MATREIYVDDNNRNKKLFGFRKRNKDWVTVRVISFSERCLAYLVAKQICNPQCPKCGGLGIHTKDCIFAKEIREFEEFHVIDAELEASDGLKTDSR